MALGTIRVLRCVHPRYSWEVKWYEGGKRQRRYYTSERDAKQFAAIKKRELFHAAPADDPISTEERRALLRARELSVPLMAAVEAYSHKLAVERRSLPMAELVRRRLSAAAKEHQSKRYEMEYSQAMKSISETFGVRSVSSITTEECAAWIHGSNGTAASTLRKRRVMLSGLFAFGQRIGVIETNPAHKVKSPRGAAVETVGILTPAESRAYLLAVATLSPALLPLEAICLFGGLRRAEAERLDWSAVQIERGFIEVSAGIAKTRSRRLVDVEPALRVILEPLAKASGPLLPANARRLRNRAMKAAGWLGDKYGSGTAIEDARPWPENALRHSFVSYHLALYGDVARTELQAGHDRKVLFAHYRELVTKDAAEEFWAVHLAVSQ